MRINKMSIPKKKDTKKWNFNKLLKNGICMIGMVLLVITALFLPQFIFRVQDEYRMKNTEVEVRSSLDISQLNLSYEQQVNTRLCNFLNMRNRAVTAIDYEFTNDSELKELLESIFYQGWFSILYENMQMTNYVDSMLFDETFSVNVMDSKKYLVHGKDYQDGIILMMWYLDLYLYDENARIRLLVDTETDTIYYAKITVADKLTGNGQIYDKYAVDKGVTESLYYFEECIPDFYVYYAGYYKADAMSYSEYEKLKNDVRFVDSMADDTKCEVIFHLPYEEELSFDFLFKVEYNGSDIYPDITMGLSAIGEEIPEMLQD